MRLSGLPARTVVAGPRPSHVPDLKLLGWLGDQVMTPMMTYDLRPPPRQCGGSASFKNGTKTVSSGLDQKFYLCQSKVSKQLDFVFGDALVCCVYLVYRFQSRAVLIFINKQFMCAGMFALLARFVKLDEAAPETPPPPSYADIMFADGKDGTPFVKPGNCVNDYPHLCSGRGEGIRRDSEVQSIHA